MIGSIIQVHDSAETLFTPCSGHCIVSIHPCVLHTSISNVYLDCAQLSHVTKSYNSHTMYFFQKQLKQRGWYLYYFKNQNEKCRWSLADRKEVVMLTHANMFIIEKRVLKMNLFCLEDTLLDDHGYFSQWTISTFHNRVHQSLTYGKKKQKYFFSFKNKL